MPRGDHVFDRVCICQQLISNATEPISLIFFVRIYDCGVLEPAYFRCSLFHYSHAHMLDTQPALHPLFPTHMPPDKNLAEIRTSRHLKKVLGTI